MMFCASIGFFGLSLTTYLVTDIWKHDRQTAVIFGLCFGAIFAMIAAAGVVS